MPINQWGECSIYNPRILETAPTSYTKHGQKTGQNRTTQDTDTIYKKDAYSDIKKNTDTHQILKTPVSRVVMLNANDSYFKQVCSVFWFI